MADTTRTDMTFAKSENTKEKVHAEAKAIANTAGVVSATVEDRGDNWVIVIERQVF